MRILEVFLQDVDVVGGRRVKSMILTYRFLLQGIFLLRMSFQEILLDVHGGLPVARVGLLVRIANAEVG